MSTESNFVVLIFFSLLGLIATIIFSGTLLSRVNEILSKIEESEQ